MTPWSGRVVTLNLIYCTSLPEGANISRFIWDSWVRRIGARSAGLILEHRHVLRITHLPVLNALACCFSILILISETTTEECGPDVRALSAGGIWLLVLLRRIPGGPPVHPTQLQQAGGEGTHRQSWKSSKQVKEPGKMSHIQQQLQTFYWIIVKQILSTDSSHPFLSPSYASLLVLCQLWRDFVLGFSSWWFMRYLVLISQTATS